MARVGADALLAAYPRSSVALRLAERCAPPRSAAAADEAPPTLDASTSLAGRRSGDEEGSTA
jgi:hypothetical protein